MDILPVRGTGDEKSTGRFFDGWQDWSDLFGRCNWYDFTLIRVDGEYCPSTGRFELHLAILGFHLMIQYVYSDAFNTEINVVFEEYQSLKKENPASEAGLK